jgi:hypothetical protein
MICKYLSLWNIVWTELQENFIDCVKILANHISEKGIGCTKRILKTY